MSALRYLHTGVMPLDYLVYGTMPGKFIQIVGGPDGHADEVALNFLRSARNPAYIVTRGDTDHEAAREIAGEDTLFAAQNGEEALRMIREIVHQSRVDVMVVNDLPSIVTEDERETSEEAFSIIAMAEMLLDIKYGCVSKDITVVFVNHLRDQLEGVRSRIYGGNVLTKKMQLTIACEPKSQIARQREVVGYEVILSVMYGSTAIVGKRTVAGLLSNGVIDNAYWLYGQAVRLGIIKRSGNKVMYKGIAHSTRWQVIDWLRSFEGECERLHEMVWEGLGQ